MEKKPRYKLSNPGRQNKVHIASVEDGEPICGTKVRFLRLHDDELTLNAAYKKLRPGTACWRCMDVAVEIINK